MTPSRSIQLRPDLIFKKLCFLSARAAREAFARAVAALKEREHVVLQAIEKETRQRLARLEAQDKSLRYAFIYTYLWVWVCGWYKAVVPVCAEMTVHCLAKKQHSACMQPRRSAVADNVNGAVSMATTALRPGNELEMLALKSRLLKSLFGARQQATSVHMWPNAQPVLMFVHDFQPLSPAIAQFGQVRAKARPVLVLSLECFVKMYILTRRPLVFLRCARAGE